MLTIAARLAVSLSATSSDNQNVRSTILHFCSSSFIHPLGVNPLFLISTVNSLADFTWYDIANVNDTA